SKTPCRWPASMRLAMAISPCRESLQVDDGRPPAAREAVIVGLCESPLTFQAIIIWRDELMNGSVRACVIGGAHGRSRAHVLARYGRGFRPDHGQRPSQQRRTMAASRRASLLQSRSLPRTSAPGIRGHTAAFWRQNVGGSTRHPERDAIGLGAIP